MFAPNNIDSQVPNTNVVSMEGESFAEKTGVKSLPKYFDAISLNRNKQLALVASNLTGKFWHGAIGVFIDAKLAPNLPHMDYATAIQGGCVDVVWVDEERVAVATDHGTVDVWKLKDCPVMESSIVLAEHDDICCCIDISKHSSQLVSGSYDTTIKLWDLAKDLSIDTFSLHTDKVVDVAWSKDSLNIFASASEDGTVILYDKRATQSKPCSLLFHSPEVHPTRVDWIDEHKLVVGMSNGSVGMLTMKDAGKLLKCVENAHSKGVNKVLHLKDSVVASVSDDLSVKVHHLEYGTVSYSDFRHTDYVQDLVYSQDELLMYSCGYDGQVLTHNVDFVGKL